MAGEVDAVPAEWLRGEILVIAIMSAYYVIALWLTGLDVALPIGIITGLAVIVPYVGIVVGLFLATAAALVQFDSLAGMLWVWLAIGIGQALEGMFVTPLIVGVLLALPAAAALLVGLRHLRAAYLASPLYGER
jgi:predicted PurR-regulated permease PerM